ncbi:MAG: DNA gyrase subunit A [Clostridia bacterium]|nr:DNA gyrase subunit A [Clostridia bacterium]
MDEQQTPITGQEDRMLTADLEKEMKKSFLEYSMSVIVARALPDVRDGLKPVHRRILYTMHENNLTPDKAYRKCADTVGTVLGRYHPHGDASVYDAMVRMAQDFSLRYPLVDGHGNFGSIDGHPAAAYRYTEARMSKMSLDMLTDIEKETVDFVPNYDDRLKEPTVLPSRFPNLLVNGSSGIAVGMATNIPPHNLCEVVDGICALIDDPDLELADLMEYIKGPDFPTGGTIMGHAGIRAAYGTGRGRIIVRARTEIEETSNGRFRIIISEIPYQVNKLNLVKSIVELADEKRVEGIHDVVDHSSREGMRIVIDLDKTANPQVVLNQLFKFTQMQVTFGAIMLTLVGGVPRVLTLKEMLQEYIKFQCEVIERRTAFDLRKAKEREHILEALKKASDFIDEVIAIIRNAPDIPVAKERLMERFQFDDVQADAIVKMRLGQLAGLERQKIEDELGALLLKIQELESILADHGKVLAIVKEECLKMRDKYGDERRTDISIVSGEVDVEDLIPEEDCVLTLTRFGYIKRQAADVYKAQRRGGKGIRSMTTREEDVADTMLMSSTHDYVMFFTTEGRVYRLECYEIPEGSRTSKGMNVVNLLPLQGDEKVTMMLCVPDLQSEGRYLCMITKRGIIKRTRLDAYQNTRKNGLIAIDLDEGDSLVQVLETDGYQSLLVATKKGMAIRFDENDARVIGRTARGVRALRLGEGDEVVGMVKTDGTGLVLTVAETGYGRLSPVSDYRVQSRGGKGLKNYHVARYGDVAGIRLVNTEDDLILISSDGILIRMMLAEIRECRRPSKGVRIMRVAEDATVVAMVTAPHDDTAEMSKPTETEGADEGGDVADEPDDEVVAADEPAE